MAAIKMMPCPDMKNGRVVKGASRSSGWQRCFILGLFASGT